MNRTGMGIENGAELQRLFKKLDLTDKENLKAVRSVIKAPFNEMRKNARANLRGQGSVKTGNLYRGLSVGTSFKKSRHAFSVAFGGRKRGDAKINHFHLINSGTKRRFTKSGAYRGAVGKATTPYRGRNSSFRTGFADKAILSILPRIPQELMEGIRDIVFKQLTKNYT